jgi:hypothetical protein
VVEHLGMWRAVDRWPTLASLFEPAVSQADTAAGAEQWPKFILNAIFPTRAAISTSLSTNRSAWRESELRVIGGEVH